SGRTRRGDGAFVPNKPAEADPAYAFFFETARELSKVHSAPQQWEAGQLSRLPFGRQGNGMTGSGIATTPEPPYFAVIFTSARTEGDNGYAEMAEAMVSLASQQPGFLGIESVRGTDGLGITVSYWASEDAIMNWKLNSRHQVAQRL